MGLVRLRAIKRGPSQKLFLLPPPHFKSFLIKPLMFFDQNMQLSKTAQCHVPVENAKYGFRSHDDQGQCSDIQGSQQLLGVANLVTLWLH